MIGIVIVGVGGQGSLLASRILGHLAIERGLDVKVSEVHGMSQRGGSVITHVRMDEGVVHAPLVEQGGADAVLALEELEALRALPYAKAGGLMVVNTQRILPLPVITGAAPYPEDIFARLEQKVTLHKLDALSIAVEQGNPRAANVVLMGALSAALPFTAAEWDASLRACVPEKFLELNVRAFEAGRKAGGGAGARPWGAAPNPA